MRILFFAHLKNVTGCSHTELRCGPVNAEGLWHNLLEAYPALAPYHSSVRLARNAEYSEPNTLFAPADEVALIPPVSGG
jgi:molybdopterin converting factor small subunit